MIVPQYKELCDNAPYEVLAQNTQECINEELYDLPLNELLEYGEYTLSLYYEVNHLNEAMREEEPETWKSEVNEIKSWVRKVKTQLLKGGK